MKLHNDAYRAPVARLSSTGVGSAQINWHIAPTKAASAFREFAAIGG
jgi:hypothetical protein